MKKILIVLLLPVIGVAQGKKHDGFEIKGNISGLKDTATVLLLNGMDGKTITSAIAHKGVFTLKGKLVSPEILQLGFAGSKEGIDLFIYNDEVAITGDIAAPNNIVIKGSATQEDYQLFKQRFNPLKDKLNGTAALINPETDKLKKDSLISRFNTYRTQVAEEAGRFVKEKPASPVSAFALFVISPLMNSLDELEASYKLLQPAAKTGTPAKVIENALASAKVGAVGSQALVFTQKDTANKPVSLTSFRGKYVLVDFWASWCKPCRMENPNVVQAYHLYKDKNFTVLGVSLDQHRDNWLQAIKADKLAWTHVSDLQYWNNAVAQLYHIQSIPANMLIDPNGKIIAKDLRAEELQETLKKLLQ